MTSTKDKTTLIPQEPKYPTDTKFVTDFIILCDKYELFYGHDTLIKLENFTKALNNNKSYSLMQDYYNDLTGSLQKIQEFTGLSEQLLFIDFYEAFVTPTIIEKDESITNSTLNDMLRMLNKKPKEDQQVLLRNYYDQYFYNI